MTFSFAIGSDRQIRFKYFDWNLKKKMELRYDGKWYQLSPWALMWDDEKYYLVAFDAKHGKIVAPDSVVEQMKTEINRLVEQYKW